jgi:phosphoglycerate dehydrogenase-like enzyme
VNAAGEPAVYVGLEESYVGIDDAARRLREAVERGGGVVVSTPEEAEAVVFTGSGPSRLREVLAESIRLVQLPSAGVEAYVEAGVLDDTGGGRIFASAAYSETVAEHALALLLAGARRLHERARAVGWGRPSDAYGKSLSDSTVVILSAGGIGRALIRMLTPLGAKTVAVTRSGREIEGASESVAA